MRPAAFMLLVLLVVASVVGGYLAGTGAHGPTITRISTSTTTITIAKTSIIASDLTSGAPNSTTISSGQATSPGSRSNSTGENIAVDLTFLGATEPIAANVTIVSYQTSSGQICGSQLQTPSSCTLPPDGYLDIDDQLLRFYYLDVGAHGLPRNFTFEGVPFTNGNAEFKNCYGGICYGQPQACVGYSTPIVQNGTSYTIGGWGECIFTPPLLYLDPQGSPLVGFLTLADGTTYVLVLDK